MTRFHGWTAILLASALTGCGGGSDPSSPSPSGGGASPPTQNIPPQDPGDGPPGITYTGITAQAVVAASNAPRFADHMAMLTLMARALAENVGRGLFRTLSGPYSCYDAGVGEQAADGTGWVRAQLTNCDSGNGMKWAGTVIYRVHAASNRQPTDESWTFASASIQYDGASYAFSGRLRRTVSATTIEDTPAINLRDEASGMLFGSDGFTLRASALVSPAPVTMSGRVRNESWGYVDVATESPITLKSDTRGFLRGGVVKLNGVNSGVWFVPATDKLVGLAWENTGATAASQTILLNADTRLDPQLQTPGTALFGAAAGPPQSLEQGKPFRLFGFFSGAESRRWMTSNWKVAMVPPGSSTVLTNPSGPFPAFTPDRPGTYTFELTTSDGTTTSRDRVTHKVLFSGDDPVYYPRVSASSVGAYLGPDTALNNGAITATAAFTTSEFQNMPVTYGYDVWEPNHRSIVSASVSPGGNFPSASTGVPGFYMQGMGISTDPGHGALRFFAYQQPLQYFRPAGFRMSNPGFGLAVADLFGAGRQDIVMTGATPVTGGSVYGVFVIRNIAPGQYAEPVFLEGGNAGAVLIGDFTGDGRPDIVLDAGAANVDLLAQRLDGTWASPRRLHPAAMNCAGTYNTEVRPLLKGDFDQDGRLDIAYAGYCGGSSLVVLFQNADGTFTESVTTPETGAVYEGQLQAADVTGDGVPDLVVVAGPQTTLSVAHVDVYASRGDRTFAPLVSTPISSFSSEPFSFGVRAGAAGDYDGDGDTDILMSSPAGLFLFRQGPAGLSQGIRVASTIRPTWADVLAIDVDFWIYEMHMVDIDGDGRQDVVVRTGRSGFYPLSVLMQQPGGTLAAPRALFPGDGFSGATSLPVVRDENGDGFPDLYYIGSHENDKMASGVTIVHQRPN